MVSGNESNIDLSIKRISQHLQDLINAANATFQTAGKQILEIYHQALKEGFTPQQAKILITQRVVNVSDRYINKILPDEAKRTYTKPKRITKLKNSQKTYQNNENISTSELVPNFLQDPSQNSQQTGQNVVNITDSYKVQDTESVPIQQQQDDEFPQDRLVLIELVRTLRSELEKLRIELEDARKRISEQAYKIEQLAIKQVKTFGHKFTFECEFEYPEGNFIPVIVTVFPDKVDGWVKFDKKRGADQ